MANDKTVSLAILGVVAVIAVVGLVLLFSSAQKTGRVVLPGDKVYGGAIKDEQYPYLDDRTVGNPFLSEWGSEALAWQTGVPYRTYPRSPIQIPTDYTACGQDEFEMGSERATEFQYRYGVKCRRMERVPGELVAFCCPLPNYAKGEAREVEKQSWAT